MTGHDLPNESSLAATADATDLVAARPQDTPTAAHRYLELDGLRGVAILAVAVLHTFYRPEMAAGFYQPGMLAVPAGDLRYANLASIGWAGVDLFFVLSGFLITGILLRAKAEPHYLRNFYARRALRILPLYYAVVLFHLYVWPTARFGTWEQISYLTYWSNFWQAANPAIYEHSPGLGVTWSLAIEEQFYLVWPFLVLWLSRRWLLRLAFSTLVFSLLLRLSLLQSGAHWWSVYALTPCRVDALAVGAALALLRPRPGPAARVVVVAAMAGLVGLGYYQGHWSPRGAMMEGIGFTLTATMAGGLLVLATGNGLVAALCRQRWLRTYGKYSYAIYLLHVPVMEALVPLCIGPQPVLPLLRIAEATGSLWPASLAFVVVCCVAFLLAGALSFHLFERHFLSLKRFFRVA